MMNSHKLDEILDPIDRPSARGSDTRLIQGHLGHRQAVRFGKGVNDLRHIMISV